MTQISSATCQRLQLVVDFEIEMFCSFETVLQLGFKQSPDASEKLVQTLTVFLALSLIQFSNESDILFKFLLFLSTCLVYHLQRQLAEGMVFQAMNCRIWVLVCTELISFERIPVKNRYSAAPNLNMCMIQESDRSMQM